MHKTPAGHGEGFGRPSVSQGPNPSKSAPESQSRQARWRERNPLAAWAHSALRSAIRRGLVKVEPCEVCGAKPTDAHHDNYAKPADVRWLCRRHHAALHKAQRR